MSFGFFGDLYHAWGTITGREMRTGHFEPDPAAEAREGRVRSSRAQEEAGHADALNELYERIDPVRDLTLRLIIVSDAKQNIRSSCGAHDHDSLVPCSLLELGSVGGVTLPDSFSAEMLEDLQDGLFADLLSGPYGPRAGLGLYSDLTKYDHRTLTFFVRYVGMIFAGEFNYLPGAQRPFGMAFNSGDLTEFRDHLLAIEVYLLWRDVVNRRVLPSAITPKSATTLLEWARQGLLTAQDIKETEDFRLLKSAVH